MNFAFIKKHPYGSGAAVLVGGFVLYMLLAGGSSSATTTTATDPNAAAVQQQNAALTMQQDQESAQFAMAQLGSITSQNLATIQSNQAIVLGTQQLNNQAAQIQLGAAIQSKAIDANLAQFTLGSNNQTQVQMMGIAANEQMQKNQLQASVDNTNTMANLQLNLSATNAALQQNIVTTNAQAQVAMARINSDTTLGNAQIQAGTARNATNKQAGSSDLSTYAGVALGALAFFCDVNLKCNIHCVSTSACLDAIRAIPLVQFQYIAGTTPYMAGDTDVHVNTLSQDFYAALGVEDSEHRVQIDLIDMMGAMLGAIKELDKYHG